MPEATGFDVHAEQLRDRLVSVRRELHATAEIGLQLPNTQRIVLRELEALGLEITTGRALTSVVAVLRGALPGPTVLLRSDMDALPIREATGLEFAATGDAMHACGHDLHMAGLLGAARLLATRRDALRGSIVFMFQPGEEGYAGGRLMLEEGVLDAAGEPPVAAYAVHVDCVTERGSIVTRVGPIMGGVSALRLRVLGSGGHAAAPHLAIDPVPVAAEIVLAVQSFAARRVPATDAAVLSVTRVSSDSAAGNVLAASVDLELNIRTLSRETYAVVRDSLPKMLEGIAVAHGAELESEWIESYPVTVNDPDETQRVIAELEEIVGPDRVHLLPAPSMASEDFAYVLEQVPGSLVFFGVQPHPGADAAMHSDRAVFDDSLLPEHAALLAQLAWRRLNEEE
ncbi:MAG: M20 metallopeptidase family protein [Agrococcus casei]|uniref:M20 metallopeptidase family protein n=1 Tax=Agrococcus casei TaxID=343512 RepID=UPI003F92A5C3